MLTPPGGSQPNETERHRYCRELQSKVLANKQLIIVANRAPFTFKEDDDGEVIFTRGGGGLVTALLGLAQHVEATWIGSARTEEDREWQEGSVPAKNGGEKIRVKFVIPERNAYNDYYNVIANPLIWFLQHNMFNIASEPTITSETWRAWEHGYVAVNRLFADAVAEQIEKSDKPALVMLQDYQLYLVPAMLRKRMKSNRRYTLSHFVHIPWPGSEDWGILPARMRTEILEGLCSVDMLGFQTKEDSLNFIRTCESYLPRAHVNFRRGRIWYRNHSTHVRDFPISVDVEALKRLADSDEVKGYAEQYKQQIGDQKLVVRVDRIEPSKNIVRGFQAFDEFLDLYPGFCGQVHFLALLVPSRMKVEEYKNYLDELMAAAGRVNAVHGSSEWEPIRVVVGESYPRALAALKLYDVLLVNSIADGMNLVAKEGPVVNEQNGVVVLSERTGARQQLESGAIVISPCDVYATAEAIRQALIMGEEDRRQMASRLRWTVEREDITDWMCRQLEAIQELKL